MAKREPKDPVKYRMEQLLTGEQQGDLEVGYSLTGGQRTLNDILGLVGDAGYFMNRSFHSSLSEKELKKARAGLLKEANEFTRKQWDRHTPAAIYDEEGVPTDPAYRKRYIKQLREHIRNENDRSEENYHDIKKSVLGIFRAGGFGAGPLGAFMEQKEFEKGPPYKKNPLRRLQEMYNWGLIPDEDLVPFILDSKKYPKLRKQWKGEKETMVPPSEQPPMERMDWWEYLLGFVPRGLSGAQAGAVHEMRAQAAEEGPGSMVDMPAITEEDREQADNIARIGDKVLDLDDGIQVLERERDFIREGFEEKYRGSGVQPRDIQSLLYSDPAYLEAKKKIDALQGRRNEALDGLESRGFLGLTDDGASILGNYLYNPKVQLAGLVSGVIKAVQPETHPSTYKTDLFGFLDKEVSMLEAIGLTPEHVRLASEEAYAIKDGYRTKAKNIADEELARGEITVSEYGGRIQALAKGLVLSDSGEILLNNPETLPLVLAIGGNFELPIVRTLLSKAGKGLTYAKKGASITAREVMSKAEKGEPWAITLRDIGEPVVQKAASARATFRNMFVKGAEYDKLHAELTAQIGKDRADEFVQRLLLVEDESEVLRQGFRATLREGMDVIISKKPWLKGKQAYMTQLWDALTGKTDPLQLMRMDDRVYEAYLAFKDLKVFERARAVATQAGAAKRTEQGIVVHAGTDSRYLPHITDWDEINNILATRGFRDVDAALITAKEHLTRLADQGVISTIGKAKMENLPRVMEDLPDALKKFILNASRENLQLPRQMAMTIANSRFMRARTELARTFPIKDPILAMEAYSSRVGNSIYVSNYLKGMRETLIEMGAKNVDELMDIHRASPTTRWMYEGPSVKTLARQEVKIAKQATRGRGREASLTERVTKKVEQIKRVKEKAKKLLTRNAARAKSRLEPLRKQLDDIEKSPEMGTLRAQAEMERVVQVRTRPRPTPPAAQSETGRAAQEMTTQTKEFAGEVLEATERLGTAPLRAGMGEVREGSEWAARGIMEEAGAKLHKIEIAKNDALAEIATIRKSRQELAKTFGETRAWKYDSITAEVTRAEQTGIGMRQLDDALAREWNIVNAPPGTRVSGRGTVVLPEQLVDNIYRMLPLVRPSARAVSMMSRGERLVHEARFGEVIPGLARWYQANVQPLGSMWRIGKTMLRGIPFIGTNMMGAVGIDLVNNGLRLTNPGYFKGTRAMAWKTAWQAAYGGDEAAAALRWTFKDGSTTTLGEILHNAQKYGLAKQLEYRFGLDLVGTLGSTGPLEFLHPARLYRLEQKAADALGLTAASQFGDDFQRMTSLFNNLEGMSKGHWAKAAAAVHREAGHWLRLTNFEKNGMRNVFGFYSWYRFILPRTFQWMAESPHRLANFERCVELADQQLREQHMYPESGSRWLRSQTTVTTPGAFIPSNIETPYGFGWRTLLETPQNTLRSIFADQRSDEGLLGPAAAMGGPEMAAIIMMFSGTDTYGRPIKDLLPSIPLPSDFGSVDRFADWLNQAGAEAGGTPERLMHEFLPISEPVQILIDYLIKEGKPREAMTIRERAIIGRYTGNIDWLFSILGAIVSGEDVELMTPFTGMGTLKAYVESPKSIMFEQMKTVKEAAPR